MLTQSNHLTIEMENSATLDLRATSVSVLDSKSDDRVTVSGLSEDAVWREVSYWVSSQRYAHNRAAQESAKERLSNLMETCKGGIEYLQSQMENAQ